ncbi:F-box protein At2g26850-like isoform X2 [Arachis duranensis]|uniref:F-box protein At2g26850-like isoform X2 n=1 Tax=Arachis duranensis TaxID=130453 RepID=A0A6P4DJ61_ARADU|nr:F-box protein At2g26850-like isoform X2 [Arachis duranensis]
MSSKRLLSGIMEKNEEKGINMSLMDLPEATLDCILKWLSPIELCVMSMVCASLRDRCGSNHLWEKHMEFKWGRVIGEVAYKEWQCHIRKAKEGTLLGDYFTNLNGSLGSLSGTWPDDLYLGSYLEDCGNLNGQFSNKFMKAMYFSLETGRFWFPAQFYKGLTIYNALFSYDSKSDIFQARQHNGGWRFLGKNIGWDMVRIPPIETPPYTLHITDCFYDLKPGDHVEIQRRGITETHYGWRYGVIGHMESCNGNENYCHCQHNEELVVEFKQYPEASYMRKVVLNRRNSGEQGSRATGFFGGIRKLHNHHDIHLWNNRLTAQALQCFNLGFKKPTNNLTYIA